MKTGALVVLVFALAIVIADGNSEGDALNAWRVALSDPNNILQSWDPTLVNPCNWFHIVCNSDNSVIRVDLGNANLTGTLVPELGQLPNLQYLNVYKNNLSGAIPVEIANLTKLVSLGLDHNRLSGAIPSALGYLTSLKYLTLNSNNLSGTLPDTVIRLITHGNLQLLNVSDNHLAGTVHATNKTEFVTTTVIQDPKATK